MAPKPSSLDNLERVFVHDRHELRAWLADNHLTSPGIWLVTYRKVTGKPRPVISEIVEELLCFGWIDSKLVQIDERQTKLLCTPRKTTSHWSKPNKERVQRLTELGLMQPRGLEMVALAKANGKWDYLEEIDNLEEPDDLTAALAAHSDARRHWDASPASYRKGILYWILTAKRPETRATRIAATVSSATDNIRLQGSTRASIGRKP
jgi:uncharacterized protein YdeI (YjbR/CyaY-like superfamily)